MRNARSILVCVFLAFTVDAATFRVRYEGKQLQGSEICIFDARSFDGPLERLTTFSTVRCHSADSDVPLPKGTWNLFARDKGGHVSGRVLLVRDGRVEGDTRDLELERASPVRLGFEPGKGESIALYVERSGAVIPLVPGEREILAPEGAAVHPIGIDGGAIRWIGAEMRADRSKPEAIARPALAEGRRGFSRPCRRAPSESADVQRLRPPCWTGERCPARRR